MALDRDFVLNALLQHNYFPLQKRSKEEMPPLFSSIHLTEDIARAIRNLAYRSDRVYSGYDQVDYKATRFNNVPRVLSIPHPKAYVNLSFQLADNWSSIEYIANNENSLIKPKEHRDGRLVIMDYEASAIKMLRSLKMSFGYKFVVHTDISNCFPSIYSHAIPWALVTMPVAKGRRGHTEWFNKIDKAQMGLKRGETQGTAIGPATSNIVAEAILCRVDEKLRPDYSYVRFIDDYTCYCKTYEDAEEFVRKLATELSLYKLNLNYKKTHIESLPVQVNSDWVNDLNTHLPSSETYSYIQVVDYLDYALELQKKAPDGSVLKYAIKAIGKHADIRAQDYLLEYTLNLAMHYPVLISVLRKSVEENGDFTHAEQLQTLLKQSIVNKQSDSMCWVMYYLLKIECTIDRADAIAIIETKDCVAIAMLYLFTDFEMEIVAFANSLDSTDLYLLDQYWLLLYQLFLDGKIANPYSEDRDKQVFEILKSNAVKFIDISFSEPIPIEEFDDEIDEGIRVYD